jgi:hypothetical protein
MTAGFRGFGLLASTWAELNSAPVAERNATDDQTMVRMSDTVVLAIPDDDPHALERIDGFIRAFAQARDLSKSAMSRSGRKRWARAARALPASLLGE